MLSRHRISHPRQLTHFAEVVERGSFTRAAAALGMTQPALTRSIRQLESDLGVRLLERGRFGARPTELGRAVALHGQAVRTSFERAVADVAEWHKGWRGSLAVGATAGVAADLLPRAALSFAAKRPLVSLQIFEGAAEVMLERLQIRTLDLFIGPLASIESGDLKPGLEARHLTDYHMIVLAAPDHPLARRKTLATRDLAEQPWVLPGRGSSLRRQVESVMTQLRLVPRQPAIEVESIATTLRLVKSGGRLAILPREMLRHEFQAGHLAMLGARLPAVVRPIGYFYRSPAQPSGLVEDFVACVKREADMPPVAAARSRRG